MSETQPETPRNPLVDPLPGDRLRVVGHRDQVLLLEVESVDADGVTCTHQGLDSPGVRVRFDRVHLAGGDVTVTRRVEDSPAFRLAPASQQRRAVRNLLAQLLGTEDERDLARLEARVIHAVEHDRADVEVTKHTRHYDWRSP